ncbi:SEC14-like protein 4 [Nephila pilipes]|uniref:SEC14-like protein 4 n=1 Tax=Nephila pilipes TaxID=299642 RepID=A0A8X6MJF6_NEPPI|nr:SEC14-like protein 4 [Nephila pilipes]
MSLDVIIPLPFLIARDFDLDEAETMLRKHIAWAKEIKLDTFLTDYKPPEVLAKYFPYGFLCNDKEGRPVTYTDFGNLDFKGMWNSSRPSDVLKAAVLYAEQDAIYLHQQNKKLGKSFTKVGYIYNLENLSLANVTSMKTADLVMNHYRAYLDNYPERMKYVYLINGKII